MRKEFEALFSWYILVSAKSDIESDDMIIKILLAIRNSEVCGCSQCAEFSKRAPSHPQTTNREHPNWLLRYHQ